MEGIKYEKIISLQYYIMDLMFDADDEQYWMHWESILRCKEFMWWMLDDADIEIQQRVEFYTFLNSLDRYMYA